MTIITNHHYPSSSLSLIIITIIFIINCIIIIFSISYARILLGIARRCIEIMSNYSKERKAFGKMIGDYGQVIILIIIYYYADIYLNIFHYHHTIQYLYPYELDSKVNLRILCGLYGWTFICL